MGLFRRKRSTSGAVRGTAKVLTVSERSDSLLQTTVLSLSVEALGLEPTTVTWKGAVAIHKWPQPGNVLPVTVDPADPSEVEILWDEAPNAVRNLLPGTMSSLTDDQASRVERTQAAALDNQAALLALNQAYSRGEIDADELFRRQAEILGT